MKISTRLLAGALLGLGLAACASSPPIDNSRPSREFRFVYEAKLTQIPDGAPELRLWVPVPESTEDQEISNLQIECSDPDYQLREIKNGMGRSLCASSKGAPIAVKLSFDVKRFATTGGYSSAAGTLQDALQSDALIPLNGKVASIASALKSGTDDRSTARVLYDHVLGEMTYGKPEGVAWGRGDAEFACDAHVGNCTDFHSYFMGLARMKGIPARFEIGFSVPAGEEAQVAVPGYHCWAFFHDAQNGWTPVDISEADKHPEKAEYFFGNLDADRVTMTGGRDLELDPKPKQGLRNFFIYPYAEANGAEYKGQIERTFTRILL